MRHSEISGWKLTRSRMTERGATAALSIAVLLTIAGLAGCKEGPGGIGRFKSVSISYGGSEPGCLKVRKVMMDNKPIVPPGSICGGAGATELIFPDKFPASVTVEYEAEGRQLARTIDTLKLRDYVDTVPKMMNLVLNIYNSRRQGLLAKVYVTPDIGSEIYLGELYPDLENPIYRDYRQLQIASDRGDLGAVKTLLSKGVPQFWEDDPASFTPLQYALRRGDRKLVEFLLDELPANFPVLAYDWSMRLVASWGDAPLLEQFLRRPQAAALSADSLRGLLDYACRAKGAAALKLLVRRYKTGVNFKLSDWGDTLIFSAARNGNLEAFEWLLENGADVNARLQDGKRLKDILNPDSPVARKFKGRL